MPAGNGAPAGGGNADHFAFGNQVDPDTIVTQTPGTASTTDGTLTTILTIPIPTDTAGILDVSIAGDRTGGTGGTAGDKATLTLTGAAVKNTGGTAAVIGTYTGNFSPFADNNSLPPIGATLTFSGANAIIKVNGIVNNNYSWKAWYRLVTF
jgi:hypothetical protein